MSTIHRPTYFLTLCKFVCTALVLVLSACQTGPATPQPPAKQSKDTSTEPSSTAPDETDEHIDSTLFFDSNHASLSMRATLEKDSTKLAKGYQFQFRVRRELPVKITKVAITVGGKRIVLEDGLLYLPKDKRLVFSLSLDDSQFIQEKAQAVFLFEYEDETKIALIDEHKLLDFITGK